MNQFNGAVLVCNEKIENALSWYRFIYNKNAAFERTCRDAAIQQVATWSRWEKWINKFYTSNSKKSTEIDWFFTRYCGMFDCVSVAYQRAGILDEKEAKILSYWRYERLLKVYDDLQELVECGKPVYLNVTQAKFVNTWGLNPKREVNDETRTSDIKECSEE